MNVNIYNKSKHVPLAGTCSKQAEQNMIATTALEFLSRELSKKDAGRTLNGYFGQPHPTSHHRFTRSDWA